MAQEAVLKYLIDTNRPYSCSDVTANLRGAFTKSAVQKALDALSESGKIKCKLYGKQKVYGAIQEYSNEESDVEDVDSLIKTITEDLTNKSSSLRKLETDLKTLTSTPTTTEAQRQVHEKTQNIERLSQKLDNLKTTTSVISVDEKKKILSEHEEMMREYRKRKRICTDILEAMLEGNPKTKKEFLEELCIETDEMAHFKLITYS